MKQGMTLQGFAARIRETREKQVDFITDTRQLKVVEANALRDSRQPW